jgi:hypothetical protein
VPVRILEPGETIEIFATEAHHTTGDEIPARP